MDMNYVYWRLHFVNWTLGYLYCRNNKCTTFEFTQRHNLCDMRHIVELRRVTCRPPPTIEIQRLRSARES